MRKLRVSILLIIVALFMAVAMMKPTQQVKAGFYEYTIYVYADHCPFGPWPPYGTLMGTWSYNCFGQESGWGMRPGHGGICEYDEIYYGNECVE
ncbi:MAG TPA: hypothetical protein VF131_24315 [Blastocatellia bacterium]|nr:hypothetical protein [Blastocatellia bacterium]